MADSLVLAALLPVVVLLFLGVGVAIGARAARVSPVVGYLALGVVLRAAGAEHVFQQSTISLLAELAVVFLLFDIGVHFSLEHIRQQASDIFAFGPLQVVFAAAALGAIGLLFGLSLGPALLIGAILALSSTAVVVRLIAERHQRNCPVGLTATSILIFQDVAAIFLLIIAGSLTDGGPVWLTAGSALLKALCAFAITIVLSRVAISPLLRLVARTGNDEVFTATALLIALAAAWATGQIGLSLTLGAFLGGVTLAATPYRAVIETEIRPFRGLLLGFFFISVGLSLNGAVLLRSLPTIVGLTVVLLGVKIFTNIAASRVFRWSVPGSTQLGFLLAQGSEFAFVILSLPALKSVLGETRTSVLISTVAASLAITPTLAESGRRLAGRLRRRTLRPRDAELTPRSITAPVIIVGMGIVGRTVADALIHFSIGYHAVERNEGSLRTAIADGYHVSFGDGFDPRLWAANELKERRISVLTAPDLETLLPNIQLAKMNFPDLKRVVIVRDESAAQAARDAGLLAIVDRGSPRGLDAARMILQELGVPAADIARWATEQVTTTPMDILADTIASPY